MHTTEMPRRLLLASEVLQMVADGILQDEERVELIEGELLVVSPQGPAHLSSVTQLGELLTAHYRGVGAVRCQKMLATEPYSLPEPDLCVVRGTHDDSIESHPGGADVLLVVECSRTSHALDHRKIGVYARAEVRTYWIVDLASHHVEVRTDPNPVASAYRSKITLGPDEHVELPGIGKAVPIADVLGKLVPM